MPRVRGSSVIKTPRSSQRWSEEEEKYLEERWGQVSVARIAANLGRSKSAVVNKVSKLGLPRAIYNSDRIPWSQFMRALLGRDYSGGPADTRRQYLAHGFPMHKFKVGSGGKSGKIYYMVDIDEFWEFAEGHQKLFNFAKMEPGIFGREPEWAVEKRKRDIRQKNSTPNLGKKWTAVDDARLKKLLNEYKYGYSEIASELGRTEASVRQRISMLGLIARPIKKDRKNWMDEDIATMERMLSEGSSFAEIAKVLGRSAEGVCSKHYHILKEADTYGE
jgi:hypothetical protein